MREAQLDGRLSGNLLVALMIVVLVMSVILIPASASAQEVRWLTRMGPTNRIDPLSVAHDDSGAYVAGVTWHALPGQTDHGLSDAFVRKYSPSGALLWNDQFGGSRHDIASDVATGGTGDIFMAGSSEQVSGPH